MTTLNLQLTWTCDGGGHLRFDLSGWKALAVSMGRDELTEPLSDEDAAAFCRVVARMAKNGRTLVQARTLLQTGVTVTV